MGTTQRTLGRTAKLLGIVGWEGRARGAGSVGSLVVLVLVLAFTSTPVGAQVPAAWNVALTRAPYLTDLVASHVNVNWATDRSGSQATLKWGPVTGGSCSLANTATPTRLS